MTKIKKAFQPLITLLEQNEGKKITRDFIAQACALEGVIAKAGGSGVVSFVRDKANKTLAIMDTFQNAWFVVGDTTNRGVPVSRKATASGYNSHTSVGAVLYGKDRKLINDHAMAIEELKKQFFADDSSMTKDEFRAEEQTLNGQLDAERKALRDGNPLKQGFASRDDVVAHLQQEGHDVDTEHGNGQ